MKQGFDEMQASATQVRDHYKVYERWLGQQPGDVMRSRREEAEMIFRRVGITFAVYGAKDEDGSGTERLIPFDLIPRVIPATEWAEMEKGLCQRVKALNHFIRDVYHQQDIIRAGLVPAEQIFKNAQFRPEMMGVDVPGGVYSHISGIDIIRAANPDGSGTYYVLEDNLRVPSGVSYMLENRKMMMRLFPELFSQHRVAPVAHYPDLLLETLRSVAPAAVNDPTVVVLTPGMHNSAYFEHAFLSQQMGVELVEGQDLFVKDKFVYMRTTQGPKRVDVIYRRVDDDFLDPLAFRPDSTLGCAGLLDVYRAGNVTLARLISGLAYAGYAYSAHPRLKPFAPTLHWLYDRFQAAIGGVPFPRRYGTIPKGQATPSSEFGLRSGELVRVKSYAKILSTLDTNNKNAGLFFDAEMVPFCGRIFRVRDRVHRFIDEKSGKMTSLKTPAVILDKVWCQSRYSSCRVFCPRSIFSWWREVWLERVTEGEHELRELPALDADTGGKAAIRLQPAARAVRSQL